MDTRCQYHSTDYISCFQVDCILPKLKAYFRFFFWDLSWFEINWNYLRILRQLRNLFFWLTLIGYKMSFKHFLETFTYLSKFHGLKLIASYLNGIYTSDFSFGLCHVFPIHWNYYTELYKCIQYNLHLISNQRSGLDWSPNTKVKLKWIATKIQTNT